MFNVPWVLPKYCNSEVFELTRVTICTMLLGFGQPPKCLMYDHLCIGIHLPLWAMLCMNLCWPLDHIIQPTMEKSFASDLEMQVQTFGRLRLHAFRSPPPL